MPQSEQTFEHSRADAADEAPNGGVVHARDRSTNMCWRTRCSTASTASFEKRKRSSIVAGHLGADDLVAVEMRARLSSAACRRRAAGRPGARMRSPGGGRVEGGHASGARRRRRATRSARRRRPRAVPAKISRSTPVSRSSSKPDRRLRRCTRQLGQLVVRSRSAETVATSGAAAVIAARVVGVSS